jgi:hypothetical protein
MTVGGWIRHYRGLQLAERVVFVTWSTAVLATLLALVGVTTYQAAWTAQTQNELCSVSSLSPQYSTVAGHQYRFVDTSCGKLEIHPGDSVTRALEPVTLDPIALTGSPSSEGSFVFTYQGWGSGHKLISVQPH